MRVAISGMGIAGPALAYWLLRSGHDVTLVEGRRAFARAATSLISGALATTWPSGWEF